MKLNTSVPSNSDPKPKFSSSSLMFSGQAYTLVMSFFELSFSFSKVCLMAVFEADPKLSSTTVRALCNVSPSNDSYEALTIS